MSWRRASDRLADPDRMPRVWWFPPTSRIDEMVWSPAERDARRLVIERALPHLAETVRRTLLILIGIAFASIAIVLSVPDSALIKSEATIRVPHADISIEFLGFASLMPVLLLGVLIYLHVHYGHWLVLDRERKRLEAGADVPSIAGPPTLFALDGIAARGLTAFLFYWLAPMALAVIAWKAGPRPEWGFPLGYVTGAVLFALAFLAIRRCAARYRGRRNPWLWLLLFLIVRLAIVAPSQSEFFFRPLNLRHADLPGADLASTDLRAADLTKANLSRAQLTSANLTGAKFVSANLSGAVLVDAILREAVFLNANLDEADLSLAHLQRSVFLRVSLTKAKINGASLARAVLIAVRGNESTAVEADLTEALLADVDLSGALLASATFARASLYGVRLGRAVLRGAQLRETQFVSVDLRGADLSSADLRRARLSTREGFDISADVQSGVRKRLAKRFDKWSADVLAPMGAMAALASQMQSLASHGRLYAADFEGANLSATDFREADLQGAVGLVPGQIRRAVVDSKTMLPVLDGKTAKALDKSGTSAAGPAVPSVSKTR